MREKSRLERDYYVGKLHGLRAKTEHRDPTALERNEQKMIEAQRAFQALDSDSDGTLSMQEFRDGLRALTRLGGLGSRSAAGQLRTSSRSRAQLRQPAVTFR